MQTNSVARQTLIYSALVCVLVISMGVTLYASSIVEFTAVGKVESIYRNRVSMRILQIVGSETAELPVASGSWVSFDLPREYRDSRSRRNRGEINYGHVIEAQLIGNIATEYELKTDAAASDSVKQHLPTVLLWTAQSVKKVKNPGSYLPESEKTDKDKNRRRKKEKKPEEPLKIWTQEETVRGEILVKNDKVYIKEDRLGKRDKGLCVITESWAEKLKDLGGNRVVLHG
ncbi:MAG: hypothetical protein EOM80_06920, partial [Erysipelotrichia bacterium]|nr:hypothetical protein [Erysipelotrichia bacterium]